MKTRVAGAVCAVVGVFAMCACAALDRDGAASGDASRFAAETAFPYYTSDPYGRRPGIVFPTDPADYFERRETARALAAEGDCRAATPMLEELVDEFRDDPKLWVDLGLCQSALDQNAAAIGSLQAALELGTGLFDGNFAAMPAEVMVRIGWLYAEEGDAEEALAWIKRGLDARYANRPFLAQAPEAAALEGNAAFAVLAGLPPEAPMSRDEQWRYDIAFLGDQVALLHVDPDHHTPAAELERALQELSDAVPDLSDEQIVARIQLFFGLLGAGHDVAFLGTARSGAPSAFALRPYLFTDGLYVIAADDEGLIGARIEAFGDTPTDVAFETVSNAMARDNNMTPRWNGPFVLMTPAMLEALGIVEDAETATLTVADRDGRRRVVRPALGVPPSTSPALAPPAEGDAPLYLSRLDEQYWFERLDETGALYVQINGMSDALEGESFTAFLERLEREIADPSVISLIVDLRHNLGGSDPLVDRLLRVLVHFDAEPDKGRLYVLIGRNTFSASQIFISKLEPLTDAVFVGEPSSSRPNFIGRTGQFALPYSGLSGFISSEYAQNSGPEDHRIWTAPDVPVGLSSQDFFAGRDPALEAIKKLIATER